VTPKNLLRGYVLLTALEAALIGVPLFQARSLGAGGYSLPRLILLGAWALGFIVCVWLSLSAFKQAAFFEFVKSRREVIWEWLIVFNLICWGGIALFFLQPDFFIFIWKSALALFEQYFLVVLIGGIWAAQSLFALWIIAPETPDENIVIPKAVQIFLIAFFFYAYTAVHLNLAPYSTTAYFPELAQSFLHGHADLPNPSATKDLTLFNGKYYVSFPPLGALLMTPLVALRGAEEFNVILFNIFFAALGVAFMFLALEAMRTRGLSQLHWLEHAALALFLGFGTAQYSMALRGLVNFTSQILTTTFLALALWLVLSLRRIQVNALLTGVALGLALLARPNVVFAWIAVAAAQLQILYDDESFSFKKYFQWIILSLAPVAAAVLALFWYNQIRFGSPFDFGYTHMLVAEVLKNDLATYGQFHPHFILNNLRDNFLNLPYWDEKCKAFTFNPQGTSILFASPLVIYSVTQVYRLALRHAWILGAWLSILATVALHLMYYNSGAVQVAYRFSLDFMPIVVMLLAFVFKKKIPATALILLAFSIFVNYFGALWSVHRGCENF